MKLLSLSALRTSHLYPPKEIFRVLITIGTDSTPGPYSGRKDYVNGKF